MRKAIIGIYKITSPSGRHYIGQSVDVKRRWTQHRCPKRQIKQPVLLNSFIKYGVESHEFTLLESLDQELNEKSIKEWLDSRELWYSIKFNSVAPEGLNLRAGKGRGYMSPIAIERNRVTHLGSKNVRYGKHLSEETKQKLRGRCGFWKGKSMTPEVKEKMSKSGKGKFHEYRAKPVDQYSKEGEFIQTHRSIVDATRAIGAGSWDISNCLHGRQKTCKGYFWKFHDEKQIA